jgi:hypothetical protein
MLCGESRLVSLALIIHGEQFKAAFERGGGRKLNDEFIGESCWVFTTSLEKHPPISLSPQSMTYIFHVFPALLRRSLYAVWNRKNTKPAFTARVSYPCGGK